jgi:hypothetical protein
LSIRNRNPDKTSIHSPIPALQIKWEVIKIGTAALRREANGKKSGSRMRRWEAAATVNPETA